MSNPINRPATDHSEEAADDRAAPCIRQPVTPAELRNALEKADLRVLLMVLVHMTGDTRWLEPPYQPKRDIRLIPDPGAGLAEEVQREIRDAAAQVLSERTAPAIHDPGDDLMHRMMSVSLGEKVSPEYAPMNREEMALTSRQARWTRQPDQDDLAARHVLIVGAGVSGIALGVRLGQLGIPYTIVEKDDGVGGTWYRNRYPGCGVDTPNHSYSYSFGPRYRWTRYFSRREEVLSYLEGIVDEYGVRESIRFDTALTSARWDAGRCQWICTLETDGGLEEVVSGFLVSSIGQLSEPSVPRIAGVEDFQGPCFHSSRWPEDLQVQGKRVAVIGTGATAMQLVPTIADVVAAVTVYQRTAQWARPIPGYSDEINPQAQWLLENVPYYAEWFRFNMFWRYGDGLLPFLRKDPDWPHPERSVNKGNDRHREELTNFIKSELRDRPDLIKKSVPDYPPYGKRILLDNGWYRALRKPTVELVTTGIDRICPDGVLTEDGAFRLADIVVYSTGFNLTQMAARLNITGRNGLTLAEAWKNEDPRAYLGISVPRFPNFFCMQGPNAGPAHGGSAIFQAECQARYITACLVEMIERRIPAIDLRQHVQDEYLEKVDAEHEQLIWTHPGMSTYYRNRHGRVFSVMPWRFVDYWAMTHDPDLGHYEKLEPREAAAVSRGAAGTR